MKKSAVKMLGRMVVAVLVPVLWIVNLPAKVLANVGDEDVMHGDGNCNNCDQCGAVPSEPANEAGR